MPGAKQLSPGTAAGVKNPKSSVLCGIDHGEILSMNWTTDITGNNHAEASCNWEQVKQSQGLCFSPRDMQHVPAACTWGVAPPCRALAPLCLLLHSSHPPQPKEPGAAPGPSQLFPCQGTGRAPKGEISPLPSCQNYCLCWRPSTIPARHPPTSSSLQFHLRQIHMDTASIPAPTAPALIFFLVSSDHFAPSRRMIKATLELQAVCFSHLCQAWANSPLSIYM